MCQATVYLGDEVIMHDVAGVEPVPEGVKLTALLEPPRVVAAVIREIDLLQHRVVLEPLSKQEIGG